MRGSLMCAGGRRQGQGKSVGGGVFGEKRTKLS